MDSYSRLMIDKPFEYEPLRPKWEQIAQAIRARISSGEYPVGHLLSAVQIQQEFHPVNKATVDKAIRALREDGLIKTRIGYGSEIVAKPEQTQA